MPRRVLVHIVHRLHIQLRALQHRVVDPPRVVKNISCPRTVRRHRRRLKPKVLIIGNNLLVDRLLMNRDRDQRNLRPLRVLLGEEPPVQILIRSRSLFIPLRRQKLNPHIVQDHRLVAVIGHNHPHRQKSMRHIRQPKELAALLHGARIRRHRHLLIGMDLMQRILRRSLHRRRRSRLIPRPRHSHRRQHNTPQPIRSHRSPSA